MKNRRNKKADSGGDWILTYSDVVTLLLAFFVLLFSFSEIDASKWRDLVRAFTGKEPVVIDETVGDNIIGDPSMAPVPSDGTGKEDEEEKDPKEDEESEEDNVNDMIDEDFKELYGALLDYSDGQEGSFDVIRTEYQIRIRLSNNLLFGSGKAKITEENAKILDDLGIIILEYNNIVNKIVIEGNTDDIPINNSEFKDNFELSLQRSMSVLYYLKDEMNFNPRKLIPMGYGEYNPIGSNDTVEGRAKNRRTDIVLVKERYLRDSNNNMDYGFFDKQQSNNVEDALQ